MTSISLALPPPRKMLSKQHKQQQPKVEDVFDADDEDVMIAPVTSSSSTPKTPTLKAPNYKQRCEAASKFSKLSKEERQKLFVPRSIHDFDDGGAFPEIHIAQYPRHMGNPHLKSKNKQTKSVAGTQTASQALVNIEVDKDGEVSYDAIVKGGTNTGKTVYSRHDDMVAREAKEEDITLPSEYEQQSAAAKTQAALQKLIGAKTALNTASGTALVNADTSKNIEENTQFIKYTPRPDAPGYNPAAAQRVIQMVPKQVDPMQPPKHKHVKAPRGPAEDAVPVLHAPPKKLSKEERDKWNVPACISNWKNSRGYTIPLDKRLAADGRGLREHTINPNFATLSESLYVAERQARQEVKLRSQVQKKLAIQEKEKREEELRELANQARMERSGLADAQDDHDADDAADEGERKFPAAAAAAAAAKDDGDDNADRVPETDDDVAARQRERLRQERRKEREREMRLEKNMKLKKQKLEEDRDVSGKVALGQNTGAAQGGEVDSRLYNQSAGLNSGFGADEDYNTYSKPLFDRSGVTSSSIYRPSRGETAYNADESYDKLVKTGTSKFQATKGFAGAEGGADHQAGPRNAPVQFEKGK
eukprot:CAMPEP_0119560080 /NCGR_PEP_ID=MMETSP1352-20130426/13939_1 /TAXON_ID=265584 /ORGANISM="Stauroneis constricta, Strain CCMP1120" /LENGTH=590 /DNA_ID=CAMNT_0007607967 /DNA_START=109 /DNA_END=1881 /DNA_ORIENTATION=+